MAETACGKTKKPVPSGATPEQIACHDTAWDLFASSCANCADSLCVEQLWAQYENSYKSCVGIE